MFNAIPSDPYILLSYINTRLRDEFDTLDALCDDLCIDVVELSARMATIGYTYDSLQNKFI